MFGFGGSKTTAVDDSLTASSQGGITPLSELGGSNKVKQLKQQVRQEMSVAHAQELVQTMTKHCFESCTPVPGDSLSSSQQKCVTQCMGLYTQVSMKLVVSSRTNTVGLERYPKILHREDTTRASIRLIIGGEEKMTVFKAWSGMQGR